MATELDHDVIKQKIVAILQANTSLYTTTAETGELRSIEVGFPQGGELADKMPPYAFITNSDTQFETIIPMGSEVSNKITGLVHTFHYDITVVVNEKDSRTAEVELDEFQKLILQTLEDDFTPTGSGSGDVDGSYPTSSRKLRVRPQDEGQGFKGRVITYRCIKTTNIVGTEPTESVLGISTTVSIGGVVYPLKKLWNLTKDHPLTRDANSDGPDYTFGRNNHSFSVTIEATTPDLPTIDGWTDELATGDITELAIIIALPPISGSEITASFNAKFAHSETSQPTPEGKVLVRLDGVITSGTITWA